MNKKKFSRPTSIILTLSMVLALTACGGSGGTGLSDSNRALQGASVDSSLAGLNRDNTVTGYVSGNIEGFTAQDGGWSSDNSSCAPSYSGINSGAQVNNSTNSVSPTAPTEDFTEKNFQTSEYESVQENRFLSVKASPMSTFGADVDTASYSNVRNMLKEGYWPIPSGAVREEEFINYFHYDYEYPKNGEPFSVNTEIIDCPWNNDTLLMRIGVQTPEIGLDDLPPSNLVFLVDTSGSMFGGDRLGLVQEGLSLLVDELGPRDRISLVTYAGSSSVVLEGVSGDSKLEITTALNNLSANGSTNGGEGITTAYKIADKYFVEGGNNRVIICTDGDLNVGITDNSSLVKLIESEKTKGVYLSTLGVGDANYNDAGLETLADHGNGNYSYLDSLMEAKKVLVDEMGGTLVTVAKDAKFQIEFNPAYIKGYRQIGYENRQMAAEDFSDDTKDGGEIGAGQQVTVLYELVPVDSAYEIPEVDMKYNNNTTKSDSKDWLNIAVRYKEPSNNKFNNEKSKLLEFAVNESNYTDKPSNDTLFAGSVAEFAMLLSNSEYTGGLTYSDLVSAVNILLAEKSDDYRVEFLELIKTADVRYAR